MKYLIKEISKKKVYCDVNMNVCHLYFKIVDKMMSKEERSV